MRGGEEEGNATILSIVLAAVAIALVLTFAAITELHIDRKRLLALADAAALHAASAIDEEAYFASPGADVPVSPATVSAAAAGFIERLPPAQRARFHDLALSSATAVDSRTAQVTLSALIRPSYIPWAATPSGGLRLEVTAAARAE